MVHIKFQVLAAEDVWRRRRRRRPFTRSCPGSECVQ